MLLKGKNIANTQYVYTLYFLFVDHITLTWYIYIYIQTLMYTCTVPPPDDHFRKSVTSQPGFELRSRRWLGPSFSLGDGGQKESERGKKKKDQ